MYLKNLTTNRHYVQFDSNESLNAIKDTFDFSEHFHEKIDKKQDTLLILQNQSYRSGVMKK